MATTLQTLIDISRRHLLETSASFWTDAELLALCNRGIRDLWRGINDTYQDYSWAVDITVTQVADATTLTGVPSNCSVVKGIEALNRAAYPSLHYRPKDYNHPDFSNARSESAIDPVNGGQTIWYDITGAGAPVAAPTIHVAPKVSSTITLRLTYIPVLTELVAVDTNPIPGESDNALVAWMVAYARAKEREDRSPDPSWIAIYGTEKQNIIVALTPREVDEEEIVEAFFETWWP